MLRKGSLIRKDKAVKNEYIKTTLILILSLLFAAFLGLKPPAAVPTQEKPEGAIQSEWPEMDFTAAYDKFRGRDFAGAAQEIRKGADFLEAASEHSEGKPREDLLRSYEELKRLSGDIENGNEKSAANLREAFSRAHKSLAEYYHARLKASWLRKDTDRAGRELKTAVSNLEKGVSWADRQIEADTAKVIGESRDLAERLYRKAQWTSEEVEKKITELGEELKKRGDYSTRTKK